VATELLEKALNENAEKDIIFTTTQLNSDGEIVTQDTDDVDEIIRHRQRTKKPGSSSSRAFSSEGPPRAPAVSRRRLGDVTREFGGMEVSDDDDL
jgi:hypothetical protein